MSDVPARRRLRIYSSDPMSATTFDRQVPAKVTVDVPYEPLQPGPSGARIDVVDFDGANIDGSASSPRFYRPVDLEASGLALQDGLAPSEADPRFHQQMVYAVGMRTLEAFDRAIGRRLRPRRGKLRLFPHAFRGRNAFYDRKIGGVLFGYFDADTENVGVNLPGQTVYTCLSHDIIAHEVTHGLVDRIRPWFLFDTNPDVTAFHEAFADIVAIFSHFTLPGVVANTVAATRTELADPTPLLELAGQFGYATGRGAPLRSAVDIPNPALYQQEFEPHERGRILVAAVFDAFLTVYRSRITPLIRLATGGSGNLPAGALPPDLVDRVAAEATRTAGQLLTVCIRSFDYMPPCDPTFSDFLRALVTCDRALYPVDGDGIRLAIVDGFRRRGIFPTAVNSLAEESLAWPDLTGTGSAPVEPLPMIREWLWENIAALSPSHAVDPDESDEQEATPNITRGWAKTLNDFGVRHANALELDGTAPIKVEGFHPTIRFGEDGTPKVAYIVQYTQRVDADQVGPLAGVAGDIRRGTTIVCGVDGVIRHIMTKPLPRPDAPAVEAQRALGRVERCAGYLSDRAYRDPGTAFGMGETSLQVGFARLHGGIR
jgi:hypothetical protein